MRLPWLFALVVCGLGSAAWGQTLVEPANPSDNALATVAERSGYRGTSTSAEVVKHLDALAAASKVARRVSMGTTHEGRDIPMIVLADPPVATPAEAKASGRLVVLLFGNIHSGECDGKEALGMLARELAMTPGHPLLKNLIVVIAPNYNADGNDKVGPVENRRPGQVGPADGCGTRENAQGLDLNRDFIKLVSPEARSLVRTIREWDAAVVVDCHTTNGSHHRYLVTYAGPKSPAGDPRLVEFSRQVFMPGIATRFETSTGRNTFWYGNFEGDHNSPPRGHARWETFPAEARFGTTYIGLRGRLSVLVESYSYASYKDRVLGSLAFCSSILATVDQQREAIRALVAAADAERPAKVAVRSKAAAWPGLVTVKGFAEATKDGKSVSTGEPKDYQAELWDRFEPVGEVERPSAYLLPDASAEVVETLRAHGLPIEFTIKAATMAVQVQKVTKAVPSSRPFQNRIPLTIEAERRDESVEIPAGTLVVRTDHGLGRLAVYLLEPTSEDGLATWNFFDAWAKPGTDFPVLRAMTFEGVTSPTR